MISFGLAKEGIYVLLVVHINLELTRVWAGLLGSLCCALLSEGTKTLKVWALGLGQTNPDHSMARNAMPNGINLGLGWT